MIGVTIPVPFVALGHNARIAWGMTATGADVQDLTVERVDVANKRAMYRGEWGGRDRDGAGASRCAAAAAHCRSKSGRPVTADIRGRRQDWEGPPSWLSPEDRPAEERKAYSIRWDAGATSGHRLRSNQSRH